MNQHNTSYEVKYRADGRSRRFYFNFAAFAETEIRASVYNDGGAKIATDTPTVTLYSDDKSGGYVDFATPPPTDHEVVIIYRPLYERRSQVQARASGRLQAIDAEFDHIFNLLKLQREQLTTALSGRSHVVPFDGSLPSPEEIPEPVTITVTETETTTMTVTEQIPLPPGLVVFFHATRAPDGFLKADGANLSRTTYADLFRAIGTSYNLSSDRNRSLFRLPDLRGEFLRAWSTGRTGVDRSRALGSWQKGTFQAFYDPHHTTGYTNVFRDRGYSHFTLKTAVAAPLNKYNSAEARIQMGMDTLPSEHFADIRGNLMSQTVNISQYEVNVGGMLNRRINYGMSRPRNIALLACIKY